MDIRCKIKDSVVYPTVRTEICAIVHSAVGSAVCPVVHTVADISVYLTLDMAVDGPVHSAVFIKVHNQIIQKGIRINA